jgi:putative hydrolase of the HAD superfamily
MAPGGMQEQAGATVRRLPGVPTDRQTLVFDADDTLWENNVLFERVVEDYLDWLAHPTLDRLAIRALLDDVERANVVVHGYGSASFLRSLGDCFEQLTECPATEAEARRIEDLAAALLDHRVELVPGVAETLAELGTRHDLLLLTKGDRTEQQRKIDASDLAHHFRSVHIVAEKRAATYRALVAEQGLERSTTWMIGNSPRSDILPAREVGLGAVFIPNANTWVLEEDEIDPADDGVLHLRRFPELVQHF